MIELTDEQRQELNVPEPIAIDPNTKDTNVLILQNVYDRIKELLYDGREWGDEELRLLLAKSSKANGWNESAMDEYDEYETNRGKPCH